MCCFNRPIQMVAATRILVAPTKDGRQVTVYENKVGDSAPPPLLAPSPPPPPAEEDQNAMVLPAPLKPNATLRLLDFSQDSFSFTDLDDWFPKIYSPVRSAMARGALMQMNSAYLEVESVGNYLISVAHSLDDLDRIDPSVFQVSPQLKELFSEHYAEGFGFVICTFNPKKPMKAHPIGYIHDFEPNGKMFVPTRHLHDLKPHETEKFDHLLFSLNTMNDDESGPSAEEIEKENYRIIHGRLPEPEPEPEPEKEKKPGFFDRLFGWNEKEVENNEKEAGKGARSPPFKPVKSTPEAIALALKSDVLMPLLPEIKSIRRREVKGVHKNDDFHFTRML